MNEGMEAIYDRVELGPDTCGRTRTVCEEKPNFLLLVTKRGCRDIISFWSEANPRHRAQRSYKYERGKRNMAVLQERRAVVYYFLSRETIGNVGWRASGVEVSSS